jgi:hypothetical protein
MKISPEHFGYGFTRLEQELIRDKMTIVTRVRNPKTHMSVGKVAECEAAGGTRKESARKIWCARRDSNLSRLAGVSEAEPSRRPQANPEFSEGSRRSLARPERFELPTYCSGGLAARGIKDLDGL